MAAGSRRFSQHSHSSTGQSQAAQDTPQEGGLATPTRPQQTIAGERYMYIMYIVSGAHVHVLNVLYM